MKNFALSAPRIIFYFIYLWGVEILCAFLYILWGFDFFLSHFFVLQQTEHVIAVKNQRQAFLNIRLLQQSVRNHEVFFF